MSYGFWNDSDDFGVPNSMTVAIFELAEKHGWKDPMETGTLGCVPKGDAQLLADALKRAMSEHSEGSTEVLPECELSTADDKELLARVIRLARSGGFMYQH